MTDLTEIKKEYDKKFTDDGSYKVQAYSFEMWDWISSKLQEERESAVEGLVSAVGEKLANVNLDADSDYTRGVNRCWNILEECLETLAGKAIPIKQKIAKAPEQETPKPTGMVDKTSDDIRQVLEGFAKTLTFELRVPSRDGTQYFRAISEIKFWQELENFIQYLSSQSGEK